MDSGFGRFAGACAVIAGVSGFLYAVAFIIVARTTPSTGALLSALFLLLGALLSTAALVGLYRSVRDAAADFALWALVLAVAGAAGSAAHGGYDLANVINAPATNFADLPNPVDPRGLFTFGVSGIALLVFSRLIARSERLPAGLGYLGYLSGILLVVLYLARLIVLDPASPLIAGPALLEGFVVNPVWYAWLGASLWRSAAA